MSIYECPGVCMYEGLSCAPIDLVFVYMSVSTRALCMRIIACWCFGVRACACVVLAVVCGRERAYTFLAACWTSNKNTRICRETRSEMCTCSQGVKDIYKMLRVFTRC